MRNQEETDKLFLELAEVAGVSTPTEEDLQNQIEGLTKAVKTLRQAVKNAVYPPVKNLEDLGICSRDRAPLPPFWTGLIEDHRRLKQVTEEALALLERRMKAREERDLERAEEALGDLYALMLKNVPAPGSTITGEELEVMMREGVLPE